MTAPKRVFALSVSLFAALAVGCGSADSGGNDSAAGAAGGQAQAGAANGGAPSGAAGAFGTAGALGSAGAAGAITGAAGASGNSAGASAGGSSSAGASGAAGAGGKSGGTGGASGTAGAPSGAGGAAAGSGGTAGAAGAASSVSVITGTLAGGVSFIDDRGQLMNAHGGGINKVGDTFYFSGEYFVYSATAAYDINNSFHGFSQYSSTDLVTWKYEKLILPQQASGELGPNRNGERPHIIKCPSTGEFVLYAHAASLDYQTDKEVVYATSATINGDYSYKGPLKNASGVEAVHSDMNAFVDSENNAYVITESGYVYKLAADCHSWTTTAAYGAMAGMESPAAFKAGSNYFWIMSNKTGYRANDNQYATAAAMTGPWTNRGLVAPANAWTWISQSTFVLPVVGTDDTTYVYFGDHWQNADDQTGKTTGKNNTLATLVVQPLVISGTSASMPTFHPTWKLDIAKGTWSL